MGNCALRRQYKEDATTGGRAEHREGVWPNDSTWFVGIDWATVDHQVCVVDAAGGEVRQRPVAHTAVAVRAFVDWLRQHVDDLTTVAVGIETPRGALVATLMEQGLAVFAVNPKQLDRFRDRHTVAGAKDDRRDARVLADSLRTDAGAFHRVEMDDARLVQLREFVHVEAALATDVSRLTNRLRDQVHRVQPALLALCAAADAPWFWTLWEQAPTVAAQRRLSSEAIGAILAARRIRRVTAAEVHAAVQAPALTTAPGVLEATEAHIAVLLPQLRLIVAQRTACRHRTEALLAELATEEAVDGERNEHRDVQILRSLPGVGRQVGRHDACGGLPALAGARLSHAAALRRGGAGHQVEWQTEAPTAGADAAGLQPAPPPGGLSLGPGELDQ